MFFLKKKRSKARVQPPQTRRVFYVEWIGRVHTDRPRDPDEIAFVCLSGGGAQVNISGGIITREGVQISEKKKLDSEACPV